MIAWLKSLDWPLITRRFIFAGAIIALLFDLAAAIFGTPHSTISLQGWCLIGGEHRSFREISFEAAIFFLAGHIFGRIDKGARGNLSNPQAPKG